MTDRQIEDKIRELDDLTKDQCVYLQGFSLDCVDCTVCRQVFFNRVRNIYRAGGQLTIICPKSREET